jgi:hypothetical protein
MREIELRAFADLLSRHLATVIASERGYLERPCPGCCRRDASRRSGPAEVPARGDRLDAPCFDRAGIAARVVRDGCDVCHGAKRVWSRRRSRGQSLSDRELIQRAAADHGSEGRAAGGERPTG